MNRVSDRDSVNQQQSGHRSWTRRGVLRTAGGVATGAAGLTVGSSATGIGVSAQTTEASVTFNDQTTIGTEVVIASVSTPVDASLDVATGGHEIVFGRDTLSAGEYTDVTVTLDQRLTEDRELECSLYPADGGSLLASATAQVNVADDVSYIDGMSVTKVAADSDAGFNYPYFLYVPTVRESEASGPILVEPNNTGSPTDDFDEHLDAARKTAEGNWNGGSGRTVSDRLGIPFLVPAFPRPQSDPVDWRHYVHQLDTETMQIDSGELARVDRQLIRMVEDARERLSGGSYSVADGMLLNGFSASGNFVNRFAALHPDRVISVTAGGINGMAILPIEEAKGHTLNYQIGIADVASLTGEAFDLDAFREVNQLLYMGELDWSDTIPYGDAWSEEQKEIALDVYGPNMQRDRMPYSQSVYEDEDVSAAFKIYDRAGHSPQPAIDDIVEFHRKSIAGDDVSEFNENLGGASDDTDGDSVPRDLNGDGIPEDINGDGTFDIVDVRKLFEMLTGS